MAFFKYIYLIRKKKRTVNGHVDLESRPAAQENGEHVGEIVVVAVAAAVEQGRVQVVGGLVSHAPAQVHHHNNWCDPVIVLVVIPLGCVVADIGRVFPVHLGP